MNITPRILPMLLVVLGISWLVIFFLLNKLHKTEYIANGFTDNTASQATYNLQSDSFAPILDQALPAVVVIYNTVAQGPFITTHQKSDTENILAENVFTEDLTPVMRMGSGVIVHEDGYILTNYHLIKHTTAIAVDLFDGRNMPAKLIGFDAATDLALIKVSASNLTTIPMPEDTPEVGDLVFAIGSPYGLGISTSMGIISAIGRNHLGLHTFENFIQTDASINQGNSGGALINTHGELVGINTANFGNLDTDDCSRGVGFAVPFSTIQQVLPSLKQYGQVYRGWLGAEFELYRQVFAGYRLYRDINHVKITGIYASSPAQHAGLLVGDIITHIDRMPVTDRGALDYVSGLAPGTDIEITFERNAIVRTVTATLATRPKSY